MGWKGASAVAVAATGEHLDDLVDPRRIPRGDHLARAVGGQRIALPIAHPPARTLDDRDQRREIVELEPGLDHAIEPAAGDAGVIVALAAQHGAAGRERKSAVKGTSG